MLDRLAWSAWGVVDEQVVAVGGTALMEAKPTSAAAACAEPVVEASMIRTVCFGLVLDLGRVDLEEIAGALADQSAYEYRWLIDPQTGEITFWTADTGIDGQNPVDLGESDRLVCIDPLPSHVWYQDMADFAEQISDGAAGRRLARAIDGRGAFGRSGRCPPPELSGDQGLAGSPASGSARLPTPCAGGGQKASGVSR